MIDNTVSSIKVITDQLKAINRIRQFLTMFLYSGYLIYRIVVNNGYLALNIVLLVLNLCYASFYIYYISTESGKKEKQRAKVVKKVYRLAKHFINAIGVGLTVSSFLTVSSQGITVQNLLFAIIMPVFVFFQFTCDILFEYIGHCIKMIQKGVVADVDQLKEKYEKPIQAVQGMRATMDGLKNVKNGVVDIASSIFKRRKKKKDQKALEEPAAEPVELLEAAPTEDSPDVEVIDVQPGDIVPKE